MLATHLSVLKALGGLKNYLCSPVTSTSGSVRVAWLGALTQFRFQSPKPPVPPLQRALLANASCDPLTCHSVAVIAYRWLACVHSLTPIHDLTFQHCHVETLLW